MESKRVKRKERIGIVLSGKMKKTIIVQVEFLVRHPKYNKRLKKHSKFKVHDEKNSAQPGDRVKIMETRPISKEKHFRLVEILSKAK